MNANHKVALITGAARLGKPVALSLARAGCDVALVYRTSKKIAQATAAEIVQIGQKALLIQADLRDSRSARKILIEVRRVFKKLHIFIHMASIYRNTPRPKLRMRDWEENINVHLRSAYDLSLSLAPLIERSGGGRMIHIGDWTAGSGRPHYKNLIPYYIAKSGLEGLTQVLALELAPKIHVNLIAPGPIIPLRHASKAQARAVIRETPLGRWGGPDEVVKAVHFLIESNFVTGESIRVDGGRHLR
jgi:NAD(P)-dependent dehydrogenase (short-subunit alcohol dehydrogenase family)